MVSGVAFRMCIKTFSREFFLYRNANAFLFQSLFLISYEIQFHANLHIIDLHSPKKYSKINSININVIFSYFLIKYILIRCPRSGPNHCNYQQVKCYRLCVWPPTPFTHKEEKSQSYIWASGHCPRTGGSLPHPQCLQARSDLPAACYERLWVSSSDYCLGGFILYLHPSHPQMKLLFLLPSLYLSPYLSLPPSSLFLKCFLFLRSPVSDSLCLLCGFIYPESSAWRRNTKPT